MSERRRYENETADRRIMLEVLRALKKGSADPEATPELAESLQRCADRVIARLEDDPEGSS
jgi:hypothetical protein